VTQIVLHPDKLTARKVGVPLLETAVQEATAQLEDALLAQPSPLVADTLIVHELELAYGRPDVVVANVDLAQWQAWRRWKVEACTAPIPLMTALALQELGGKAEIGDLISLGNGLADRARLRRALVTLVEARWVERRGEVFRLRLDPGNSVLSASGVEAKLNNWRRAVRQVQSWESYVDATWLAFPTPYLAHVPRTQVLRRFGLIGVEGDQARVVRRPSGVPARGVQHLLMEQYLYRRWLSSRRAAVRQRPKTR
jgi:hypothetical protein